MRLEALTVVSISVFWLVTQCSDIDRYKCSEDKNVVSMFKAEESDPENGDIIFFRGVCTQKIIEFVFVRKHCVVRENMWKSSR
jgi:hypothetical protein